jgi:microsomal dipeptidase-like Zn-dependent dipeptidase
LQTASGLPQLTARLLERGLSEGDAEKILGGNFLRVFEQIEAGRRSG